MDNTPNSIRLGQLVILHRGSASGPWKVDRIHRGVITLVPADGQPGIVHADRSELSPY
jgi:hypothetical protein